MLELKRVLARETLRPDARDVARVDVSARELERQWRIRASLRCVFACSRTSHAVLYLISKSSRDTPPSSGLGPNEMVGPVDFLHPAPNLVQSGFIAEDMISNVVATLHDPSSGTMPGNSVMSTL